MAEPRTRPPTGEFGESLTETGTNWWDLPIAGGGGGGPGRPSGPAPATYTGKPFVTEGRQGVWNDPNRRSGAMRPPGYTGLSPAMEGAVAAYRPSPGGPNRVTLRQAKQEKLRKERMAARRMEEAVKWQKKQVEQRNKLEKEKIKAMEKLQEKNLELRKLAILKPAWGI